MIPPVGEESLGGCPAGGGDKNAQERHIHSRCPTEPSVAALQHASGPRGRRCNTSTPGAWVVHSAHSLVVVKAQNVLEHGSWNHPPPPDLQVASYPLPLLVLLRASRWKRVF